MMRSSTEVVSHGRKVKVSYRALDDEERARRRDEMLKAAATRKKKKK